MHSRAHSEDPIVPVVVIGRNEAQRLTECLQSVQSAGLPVVYVDSGSIDGSPEIARAFDVPVIELDPATPFSAGRARNEGLEEVVVRWPGTSCALFLDGDCILDAEFAIAAASAFERNPDCAIVTGHLSERYPDRTIYNRLCEIEWRAPAGNITNMNNLGGIMAIRVSVFRSLGGFNLAAIAGEEPDLGARMLIAGYRIIKLDVPMATHDAAILRFAQWWKRAVRGGHALAYRYSQHGKTTLRDGQREILSDFFWGLGLPVIIVALLLPTRGLSLMLLLAYALFAARIYRSYLKSGLTVSDASLVTRFIIYGKFAHVTGILLFCRNWLRGEFRLIEYK